jgi:5,10-methylene-tetrahydrofolate dehydrogenase/methenyl tetrahydrofolate cyclohydrolase
MAMKNYDVAVVSVGSNECIKMLMQETSEALKDEGYTVKTVSLSHNITEEAFSDYLFKMIDTGHVGEIYLLHPLPEHIEELIKRMEEEDKIKHVNYIH